MLYSISLLLTQLKINLCKKCFLTVLSKFPDAQNKRLILLFALCREEDMIIWYDSSSVSLPYFSHASAFVYVLFLWKMLWEIYSNQQMQGLEMEG